MFGKRSPLVVVTTIGNKTVSCTIQRTRIAYNAMTTAAAAVFYMLKNVGLLVTRMHCFA